MELNNIEEKDFRWTDQNISGNEHIVGEASDGLKRIWTFAEKLEEAALQSLVQARFSKSREAGEELYKKAKEFKEKEETLRRIFWICLKDEFNLWDRPVGIRKGFKVVWYESTPGPPGFPDFLDFLKNL
jgi:hypothetical protein